jgi:hypothetical protein
MNRLDEMKALWARLEVPKDAPKADLKYANRRLITPYTLSPQQNRVTKHRE